MFDIQHLNCGTLCPWGGSLVDGVSDGLTGRLVCHGLLVEADDGLILVDTGFGTEDVAEPHPRLSRAFTTVLRPRLQIEETALAVWGLSEARREDAASLAAIGRGLAWLNAATDEGRRFDPAPIGFYFANLWYSEALYPLIFTVAAAESAARLPAAAVFGRA